MGKEDPQITAAACKYLLVGLLSRLERMNPGLVAEIREGIASDRQAMAESETLSPDVDAVVSEAQRILSLVGKL